MSNKRKLREIAADVRKDWKGKPSNFCYGARPYLDAMLTLDTVDDYYIHDQGSGIVRYFLGNVKAWKGDTARAIKAELKELVAIKLTKPEREALAAARRARQGKDAQTTFIETGDVGGI